jgi:hypothetical protein
VLGAEESKAWLGYYGKNPQGYLDYYAGVKDRTRGASDISTTSQRERVALSFRVLEHLAPGLPGSALESADVSLDRLAPQVVQGLFDTINTEGVRLYGDSNGARRRKAGSENRRTVVAALNVALGAVGAELEAEYPNPSAKSKGKPSHYLLRFRWTHPDAPSPRPPHPCKNEDRVAATVPDDTSESEPA